MLNALSPRTGSLSEGATWVEPDGLVVVVLPDKRSPLLDAAAEDLKTYTMTASRARVLVHSEGDPKNWVSETALIGLGDLKGEEWTNSREGADPLGDDECEVICRADHPRKGVASIHIKGASDRAVSYGVIELLRRSFNARWLPPRIYEGQEQTAFEETHLSCVPRAAWPAGVIRCRPAIRDRGVYTGMRGLTPAAINWMRHNHINMVTISTGEIDFPLPAEKDQQLRRMIPLAKQAGLRVFMQNFTFNVSAEAKRSHPEIVVNGGIDPVSPVTKEESAKLYVDLVKRYDLDGFAWHPATEKIKVHATESFKARPRPEWEAEYHAAYRRAIKAVKPDARLIAVMGWCDMQPADAMARLFPGDTVAWIVPNTPIIDAACTDIPGFASRFPCWYWLYVSVSRDASFPVIKTDYLETYCREAVARGNGLMPQCAFSANSFNLQYVADAGWYGPARYEDFNRAMAELYFLGVRPAIEGVDLYTRVTTRYRDWTNNLHTRAVKIDSRDFDLMRAAYKKLLEAYRQVTGPPLLRDRIRDYAVAALRACKRYPRIDARWYAAEWRRLAEVMGKRPLPATAELDYVGRVLMDELRESEKNVSGSR